MFSMWMSQNFPKIVSADIKHYNKSAKVSCLILATISYEPQKGFENWGAFDIN